MRSTGLLFLILFLLPLWAFGDQEETSMVPQSKVERFLLPEGWSLGEVAGIARTGEGHFFVLHRGAHQLLEFDRQRRFIRELGAGLFENPHGLRVDNKGNIWTTDTSTHLVLRFAPSGDVSMVLGKRGLAGKGWFDRDYDLILFDQPQDVAVDSDGFIYVVDKGNSRIVKLDPNGLFVQAWGSIGNAPGQFIFPHSLVIWDGQLYVADRENQRIQIFDRQGTYIDQWEDIGYPYVLALDDGHIWVTDARAEEIRRYNLSGKLLSRYQGQPGRGSHQFGFVHGIYPDKDGLWVTQILNWSVQRLSFLEH